MSNNVEIVRNYDDEMVWVHVNGKLHFSGNFWDLDTDTWISIMESAGIEVTTTEKESDYE